MHVLLIVVAALGLASLVALNIVWFIDYGRFVRRLKLSHHEHWKAVGSPAQFEDEPRYGSSGYVEYFWSRRYVELGDSELTLLGDRMLGQHKLMLVCVLVSAACFAAALGRVD